GVERRVAPLNLERAAAGVVGVAAELEVDGVLEDGGGDVDQLHAAGGVEDVVANLHVVGGFSAGADVVAIDGRRVGIAGGRHVDDVVVDGGVGDVAPEVDGGAAVAPAVVRADVVADGVAVVGV